MFFSWWKDWWLAICVALVVAATVTSSPAADGEKLEDQAEAKTETGSDEQPKADDENDQQTDGEEKKISYELPDGGVDPLLAFIDKLENFQPTSVPSLVEHRQKQPQALIAAAERILELEKDKTSKAHKKARWIILRRRAQDVTRAQPEEQKRMVDELAEHFTASDELSMDEVRLAYGVARHLERSDDSELAATAYRRFGDILAKSDDERWTSVAKTFTASARRIELPGNEIKVEGTTVEGKPFDWAAYRGKVVLIDFWTTWCEPCRVEMPNVAENYEKYHDRGFEVVGISLDHDRAALEKFLEEEKPPWVTLHEKQEGSRQPTAEYYGISSIPTMILVDQEGKVVSLQARGAELRNLLASMLGKADDSQEQVD